jgi:hypothetical protein
MAQVGDLNPLACDRNRPLISRTATQSNAGTNPFTWP